MLSIDDIQPKKTLKEYEDYVSDVVLPKVRAAVRAVDGDLSRIPLKENPNADRRANESIQKYSVIGTKYKRAIRFAMRLPDCGHYITDWPLIPGRGVLLFHDLVLLFDYELLLFQAAERYKEEKGSQGEMVTIKQIAIESGQNESTIRGRIHRLRKMGKLTVEKQGGTVLMDRTEGLRIANSIGKHLKKL